MPRIIIEGYHCNRCGYNWAPSNGTGYRDKEDPTYCRRCRSPYWNKPRKIASVEQKPDVLELTPHIPIEGYLCERCGYRWAHRDGTGKWRDDDPKTCPKCRSILWNTPRSVNRLKKHQAARWSPEISNTTKAA